MGSAAILAFLCIPPSPSSEWICCVKRAKKAAGGKKINCPKWLSSYEKEEGKEENWEKCAKIVHPERRWTSSAWTVPIGAIKKDRDKKGCSEEGLFSVGRRGFKSSPFLTLTVSYITSNFLPSSRQTWQSTPAKSFLLLCVCVCAKPQISIWPKFLHFFHSFQVQVSWPLGKT